MIRKLLVAFLFVVAGAANAETINPLHAESDVCGRFEAYHINGIMTEPQEAQENLDRIVVVYGNAYSGHLIKYTLAYNQHRSFAKDFLDSAMQVINLYAMATWDKWMNAVTFGIYSQFMNRATAKAIAEQVTTAWGFTRPNPYTDQEMNEITGVITATSASGARLVLLPHSQGNLYANLVYDKLVSIGKPAQSIGIVGLAVPYSSLRTGNVYITSSQDLVIDAVRMATLGNILRANANIPYEPTVDVLGHNLIDTYMADAAVRSQYVSLITTEFGTLQTTMPQNPAWEFYSYPHATVIWDDCNPISYPFGCWFNGVQWFQPVMHYSNPGTQTGATVAATWDQAVNKARSNANACQTLGEAELARLRAANPNDPLPNIQIPGCFNTGGAQNVAVLIPLQGDVKQTKMYTQYSGLPGDRGHASGYVGSVCKR